MTKKTEKGTALGRSILRGVTEAIAYARGENLEARATTFHIPHVDVKKVRARVGLSQAEFARKFGFSIGTLRNWEQGRREPEVPTRILLAVIAKHPEAVEDVLRGLK
jgi:putative transcriptional regulator